MIARIFWGGGWNGGRKTRQIASSHSAAQWQSFKADSGGAKVSCNLVALVLGAKSHKFVVLTALVCSVIILWLINFFHSTWKNISQPAVPVCRILTQCDIILFVIYQIFESFWCKSSARDYYWYTYLGTYLYKQIKNKYIWLQVWNGIMIVITTYNVLVTYFHKS